MLSFKTFSSRLFTGNDTAEPRKKKVKKLPYGGVA
jgi:hypothetical protein